MDPDQDDDEDDIFYSPAQSPASTKPPSRNAVRLPRSLAGIKTPQKSFKIIIIGDPSVGKTSFIQRYVQNTFSKEYKGTVGVDFALKLLHVHDSEYIKLQLWDIAGQERFTWMTRVYYKDAQGCIIMFDLTNKKSFENTLKWKKDLDSKCTLASGANVPCMLLANKCDLTSQRKVQHSEIEAFHKENQFIGWTETSAKEGLMVSDSMRFMVEHMLKLHKYPDINLYSPRTLSFSITPDNSEKKTKCFC